jgi:hypothetical protein
MVDTGGSDRAPIDAGLAAGLPEPAAAALREWARQSANSYTLSRWYTNGRSTAVVGAVLEHRPHADARKIILKLDTARDTGHAESEYARQLHAVHETPAFAAAHLVEPVREPVRVGDGYWFTFQELASGAPTGVGLADLVVLGSLLDAVRGQAAPAPCDAETFAEVCAEIVGSVLADWAAPRRVRDLSVAEYLRLHLGDRLTPGGALHHLAAGLTGPSIEVPGEHAPLPNPFALAAGPGPDPDRRVPALVGKAHGDLHVENILVPVRPALSAAGYRLIDLSKYSSQAPLARDPVHLVLHLAARTLPELSLPERGALVEVLLDPSSRLGDLLPHWLRLLVVRVHAAAEAWAGSLVDEWRAQRPLSVLACALMFVGRRSTPDGSRDWFLRLAGRAGARYLGTAPPPGLSRAGTVHRLGGPPRVPPMLTAPAGASRDWVARLCENVRALRPLAEHRGLGARLLTLVTAATAPGDPDPVAGWDRQLDQLMWELGVDSARVSIPGGAAGRPILAERYRCPLGRCPRTASRPPSGQVPRCHLGGTEMARQLG